jgi:hypothetical protein
MQPILKMVSRIQEAQQKSRRLQYHSLQYRTGGTRYWCIGDANNLLLDLHATMVDT